MTENAWRPSATIGALQQRARSLASIRTFFAERQVLEVETPLLCHSTATDLHLQSMQVERPFPGAPVYLQTSPEFAMKRLLAAGSGAIYQLCKTFRQDEQGQRHNPEFTMLEWYRPDWSVEQLMAEVEALLRYCLPEDSPALPSAAFARITYRQLFLRELGFDPMRIADETLALNASELLQVELSDMSRDDWLNLLMADCIEPRLQSAVFVTEFPASQASLSRIEKDAEGDPVAHRFELFCQGMEIANGYQELTDAAEQQHRFAADNRQRQLQNRPEIPVDTHLLAALEHGMPDCAGVALGVDRLIMLAQQANSIADVLSFTSDHA